MESDRELLELAAKAAGFELPGPDDHDGIGRQYAGSLGLWVKFPWCWDWFRPHIDGNQALDLATELGISIEPYPLYDNPKHSVICKQRRRGDQMRESNPTEVVEVYGPSKRAATRRAIVRAAAEIGKTLG